jgi:hypothetical protein
MNSPQIPQTCRRAFRPTKASDRRGQSPRAAGGRCPRQLSQLETTVSRRFSLIHSVDLDRVEVAGRPIGVYRPEDRLTPPALRRATCDITAPRTGSSSLPCPRRPHELRASTMPSRHSFFGFAGPVDGARGELTRQGAPLFPRFETKRAARGRMQKKPRALGAARGEVGGPREEPRSDVTRQPHHLFRRSKEERPGSRHLVAALPSKKGRRGRLDGLWFERSSWPGKSNLARRSPSAPDRLRRFPRQPGITARLSESSEAVPSS